MKNIFKLFILIFALVIGCAACVGKPNETESTATSKASSSPEVPVKSDEQIVKAILFDIGETSMPDDGDSVDFYTEFAAKKLSGKLFGRITSEEDVKEKAIAALNEMSEIEEPPERRPINAKFYKECDAWVVWESHLSSYTDSNGFEYPPPPHSVPYIIIRNSNGKILAVWAG